MPRAAAELGAAEQILALDAIGKALRTKIGGKL
jgi:chemotaxis response regulator CheB